MMLTERWSRILEVVALSRPLVLSVLLFQRLFLGHLHSLFLSQTRLTILLWFEGREAPVQELAFGVRGRGIFGDPHRRPRRFLEVTRLSTRYSPVLEFD